MLDLENGSFSNLDEMTKCMHASCLLPGIAGPLMNIDKDTKEITLGNKAQKKNPNSEPLADALFYEPMPFRSAIAEGATHVISLRTRPDGTDVTGKPSFFEKLIFRRFFMRKNKLPKAYRHLLDYKHKLIYGRDVLAMNEMAHDFDRDYTDTSKPHVLTVALPPGSPEVGRLETGREAIFEGVRRGFARAYDALVEDPGERGRGAEIAKEYFPDEILNYDPYDMPTSSESAFVNYLEKNGEDVAAWKAKSLKNGNRQPAVVDE